METILLITGSSSGSGNTTANHNLNYVAGFLIAALLIIVSTLISLLRYRHDACCGRKRWEEAPEASGSWPIVGHIPALVVNSPLLHRLFAGLADKHGPAFRIRAGQLRILVISSWELAKECLLVNDRVLADRPDLVVAKHLPPLFALAPYGPQWRHSRKIVVHNLLSTQNLESLQSVWISEVGHMVRQLYTTTSRAAGPLPVDVSHHVSVATLNILTRIVAGKRYDHINQLSGGDDEEDAEEALQFIRTFHETLYYVGVQDVGDAFPFLRRFDLLGTAKALKKLGREVEVLMQKWVDEHRHRALNNNTSSSSSTTSTDDDPATDLIDLLLLSEKENTLPNHPYPSNYFIKGLAYMVIIGGADTTAITILWALSLLVNNRHVLEKAHSELDLHVGRDRIVEVSDITKLVYFQSIVKETLRLYPPGPLLAPHRAMEDCQIGGFHVPNGTTVMVNIWKIHRDPRIFVNPLEFRPERFLEENREMDVMGQHLALIPFSFGRRSCPGTHMALRVVHLALARLLQAFDWTLPSGLSDQVDMTETSGIGMGRKHPLQLLLTPRLSPELYYN